MDDICTLDIFRFGDRLHVLGYEIRYEVFREMCDTRVRRFIPWTLQQLEGMNIAMVQPVTGLRAVLVTLHSDRTYLQVGSNRPMVRPRDARLATRGR